MLTEIVTTFKAKFNSSKFMDLLDKNSGGYAQSDDASREKLRNNQYINSGNEFIKSSSELRVSENKGNPLIKLTDVRINAKEREFPFLNFYFLGQVAFY